METAASNGVEMSLTRIVFVYINDVAAGIYREYREYRLSYGTTNMKIVNAEMWSAPEMHLRLELLYGNKCRCGIFGGTAHVG